jgi:hypothetical protein
MKGGYSTSGNDIQVALLMKKISPHPSFPKRGNTSLWQREVRMDFSIIVCIIMRILNAFFGVKNQKDCGQAAMTEISNNVV